MCAAPSLAIAYSSQPPGLGRQLANLLAWTAHAGELLVPPHLGAELKRAQHRPYYQWPVHAPAPYRPPNPALFGAVTWLLYVPGLVPAMLAYWRDAIPGLPGQPVSLRESLAGGLAECEAEHEEELYPQAWSLYAVPLLWHCARRRRHSAKLDEVLAAVQDRAADCALTPAGFEAMALLAHQPAMMGPRQRGYHLALAGLRTAEGLVPFVNFHNELTVFVGAATLDQSACRVPHIMKAGVHVLATSDLTHSR